LPPTVWVLVTVTFVSLSSVFASADRANPTLSLTHLAAADKVLSATL